MAAAVLAAGAAFAAHDAPPPYPNFGLPRVEEMMFLVLQIGVIIFAAKIMTPIWRTRNIISSTLGMPKFG